MILGSIIGLGGGIIQDIISFYKDKKQRELDIAEWKQKAEISFELDRRKMDMLLENGSQNIEIARLEHKKASKQIGLENAKNEGHWYNAIVKAQNYLTGTGLFVEIANFIIATTRPIISYLFLFFICYIYKTQAIVSPQWIDKFVMAVLLQMEVITSFWFYRRGSDRTIQNVTKK